MTDLSNVKIPSLRSKVSESEWQARIDLAACYRLIAHFDMNDLIYNHATARVPNEEGHFLINAYGYAYEEVTASSLVKIDFDGNIVHDSGTGYGINQAGFVIHSAIPRQDVGCVIHTHSPAGMAISALECGLLPITQNAMFFGQVGYHDYEGPAIDLDEQKRLVRDLGVASTLILRNHGLLTAGTTVCEAFVVMHWLEKACQAQVMAMSCQSPMNKVKDAVVKLTNDRYAPGQRRKITELEWPALLRMLDRRDPSFRD
ncbi:MAG: class II aldolase/adducin family protein [Betaproteobacteria bacterium]|nr:class II aldolase/adducin family protein [Betaproteobacteria bacterium]